MTPSALSHCAGPCLVGVWRLGTLSFFLLQLEAESPRGEARLLQCRLCGSCLLGVPALTCQGGVTLGPALSTRSAAARASRAGRGVSRTESEAPAVH